MYVCSEMCNATCLHENLIVHIGSVSVSVSLYVCVYVSVCLCICLSVCLYISLFICVFRDVWSYQSTWKSNCLHWQCICVYVSVCLFLCLCMSVYMSVYACMYVCLYVCSEMCNATSLHENLIVHIGSAHRLPTQWKNTSVHLCHSLFFLSDVYCSFYAKCTHNTLHSILWTHTATRQ